MPLLRSVVRYALGLFFRHVEVVGADRVPRRGPLLVVATHFNGLIDPALLLAQVPRSVRFLAKSTLWEHRLLRPLLELAGAIPVYRRQDQGVDPARNRETFAAARQVLASGGVVAIFPEGISHDRPHLMPLKTGAARIALEAEELCGPLAIQVVPVGLLFDAKERFRSRALVSFGVPIAVPAAQAEDPSAVERLTAAIGEGLESVSLSYESWEEAELFEQAAELWAEAEPGFGSAERRGAAAYSLAASVPLRRALVAAYRPLREAHPRRVAQVAEGVRSYRRLLEQIGIRDRELQEEGPSPARAALYLLQAVLRLALLLPLAAAGGLLNSIPYRLTDRLSRRAQTSEETATYKLLGALLLYPATWMTEAAVAALALGVAAGLGMALLAPFSGYAALVLLEAGRDLKERLRAQAVLRGRQGLRRELLARRRSVTGQMEELRRLYDALHETPQL